MDTKGREEVSGNVCSLATFTVLLATCVVLLHSQSYLLHLISTTNTLACRNSGLPGLSELSGVYTCMVASTNSRMCCWWVPSFLGYWWRRTPAKGDVQKTNVWVQGKDACHQPVCQRCVIRASFSRFVLLQVRRSRFLDTNLHRYKLNYEIYSLTTIVDLQTLIVSLNKNQSRIYTQSSTTGTVTTLGIPIVQLRNFIVQLRKYGKTLSSTIVIRTNNSQSTKFRS